MTKLEQTIVGAALTLLAAGILFTTNSLREVIAAQAETINELEAKADAFDVHQIEHLGTVKVRPVSCTNPPKPSIAFRYGDGVAPDCFLLDDGRLRPAEPPQAQEPVEEPAE
jgi:hypothetical protein